MEDPQRPQDFRSNYPLKSASALARRMRKKLPLFALGIVLIVVMFEAPSLLLYAVTTAERYSSGAGPPEHSALNILENTFYMHHPVMRKVSREMVPFDKDYLIEVNNLRIPAEYDCTNMGSGRTWGGYSYFTSNPSRWYACWLHYANVKSGAPGMVPALPLIDEEYFEHIAVFDSVLQAKEKYTIVELGARWGTWGSRAIAFLRKVNPMPYDILFVESTRVHCDGLEKVMAKNDISYDLVCDYARGPELVAWAQDQPHINLLDLDVQGAEKAVLANEEVLKVVEEKVHRLIIGTHSEEIHTEMRNRFSHWVQVHDMPMSNTTQCVKNYLRTPPKPDRSNFDEIVRQKCYFQSSYGKIAQYDGELILDNPKYHKRGTLFAQQDNSIKSHTKV